MSYVVPHSSPGPHTVPHLVFAFLLDYLLLFGNFTPIPQIYTRLQVQPKRFLKRFLHFQENLHCVQNWYKNSFAGLLKCYPLTMWQSTEISALFHKNTHQTLPLWLKRISETFPTFPEKLILCAKLVQKWFCWDFEALTFCYVTVSRDSSTIPQVYTPNTTILAENNFRKFPKFPRKTYSVPNW